MSLVGFLNPSHFHLRGGPYLLTRTGIEVEEIAIKDQGVDPGHGAGGLARGGMRWTGREVGRSLRVGGTDTTQEAYSPEINPADFTTPIDNKYFPLKPGITFVYTGT
jgi:hypothetical protein